MDGQRPAGKLPRPRSLLAAEGGGPACFSGSQHVEGSLHLPVSRDALRVTIGSGEQATVPVTASESQAAAGTGAA